MSDQDIVQRDILPIPDHPHTGLITYDAKDPDTSFPPIEQLRPPKGAPNVLIVLLDEFDMIIVVTADSFFLQHDGQSWKHEKANINLVSNFINSLPSE